ncbi:MAG TPA: hypothetical protein VGN42_12225 [Pirellulales bacterium]|nr:hypothetical protein [Pirellulales bacterium]
MLKHTISLATLVVVPLVCCLGMADEAPPEEKVTLLGMLLEWRYPESKFNGAETSDAAVKEISAIKSKAILTTPDSAEKVMDFYRKKLNVDAEGKNLDEKEGERITTDRSVLIQDVSGDRTSKLYVIAINGAKSSTTLVVSRTDGDDVTRIAWSNYRRLWP